MFKLGNKMWTQQTVLNKQWLKDCLTEMCKQDIIFRSEEQFQFTLSWAIKEFFSLYEICLEELTLTIDYSGEIKRSYTDILVKKEDGRFVAIELKYKTANTKVGNIELLNHGAIDNGRYDYLWDINRLERLVYQNSKKNKENLLIVEGNKHRTNKLSAVKHYQFDKVIKGQEVQGFSIILTNESKYWEYSKQPLAHKPSKYCGNVQYHDFCIAEGDETNSNNKNGYGRLQDWIKDELNHYKKSVCDIWRGRPVEFLGDYMFTWDTYKDYNVENGIFKYCITEVKN